MHVCLVTSAYAPIIDGFSTYTRDLAVALIDLGQKVTVICAAPTDSRSLVDEESLEAGIRVIRLHGHLSATERALATVSGLRQLAWSLKAYQAVRRYHRQTPFDIIEFSNWDALGAVHSLFKLAPQVVRVTTSIRQIISVSSPPPRNDGHHAVAGRLEQLAVHELELLEALAVRRSDLIIAPGRMHWHAIAPHYRLSRRSETRVRFIPFGTDTSRASLTPRFRKAWPCRLLYVGRLTQRKGFDVLMAALPAVFARAMGQLCVTILGQDNPCKSTSAWQKYSSQLEDGIKQQVEYLGPVSDQDREEAYRGCHVLVAPSRYESFGLIYIEAMCYGLPVIGCRAGGIPEVVEDEVTGLLVEPGDAPGLASAILRLVNDPALRQRLGQAARERAISYFSRERMAKATSEAYRTLLP